MRVRNSTTTNLRRSWFGFSLLVLLVYALPTGATEASASYVLPFPKGQAYKLIQGNNGPYGHTGAAEFAFDFVMPIGSKVTAARAGVVVKIEERFADGTRKPGEENYVMIQHEDGSFGRYYHLTKEGALVAVGDKVAQGSAIGLSGNSGASAGPHLHFDVTRDCFDWGCQTVRLEFANTKENPLKAGEVYTALK